MVSEIQHFDLSFSLFVQSHTGQIMHLLSNWYSNRLLMVAVVVLSLVVIYMREREKVKGIALQMAFGFVFHLILTEGIFKTFFFRLRPYLLDPGQILPFGRAFVDSSWPSSHVVVTTLFTLILLRYYQKYWPLGTAVILFMVFSRITNGMHFLTDTVSGVVIGCGYFLLVRFVFRKAFSQKWIR